MCIIGYSWQEKKVRECTRALNAVKLERAFAKPFVGALNGHNDGVYCMAKNPRKITSLISGSGDGGELNQESSGIMIAIHLD